MSSYHCSLKTISRSAGRSTTAAAAYRAGEKIVDVRTGEIHDYSRKGGVLHAELLLPGGGTASRSDFWNGLEAHHKRGDAVLSREVEIALPTELSSDQRQRLAISLAREIADRYGVAADVALHAPRAVSKREIAAGKYHEVDATGKAHNGNWHAHIMLSACYCDPTGKLGKKAVELDPIHCQRAKIVSAAEWIRELVATRSNEALERAGHAARVDHRSLAEQGIEQVPTSHKGPAVSAIERRGDESVVVTRMQQQAAAVVALRRTRESQRDREADEIRVAETELASLRQQQAAERIEMNERARAEQAARDEAAAAREQSIAADRAKLNAMTAEQIRAEIKRLPEIVRAAVGKAPEVIRADRNRESLSKAADKALVARDAAASEVARYEQTHPLLSSMARLLPKRLDRYSALLAKQHLADLKYQSATKAARAATTKAVETRKLATEGYREALNRRRAELEVIAAKKERADAPWRAAIERQRAEEAKGQEQARGATPAPAQDPHADEKTAPVERRRPKSEPEL